MAWHSTITKSLSHKQQTHNAALPPHRHFQTTPGGGGDKLQVISLHLQAPSIRPAVARMALMHLHISMSRLTGGCALRSSCVVCRRRQEPRTTLSSSSSSSPSPPPPLPPPSDVGASVPSKRPLGTKHSIRGSLTLPHNWL